MPFNGTGVFTRLYNWTLDQANAVAAQGARFDGDANDIATGLSNCVTRDGQGYFQADINANSYGLKNLKVGAAATCSLSPVTATGVGIYFPSSTSVAIATNGVNALTVDSNQNWTFAGQVAVTPYRANISGAVSIDLQATAKSNCLFLTLTGNVTSFALTNPKDGAVYNIKLIQGGAGGYTFAALPAAWKFQGGTAPVFSTGAAGTHDFLSAVYDATLVQYDTAFNKAMA